LKRQGVHIGRLFFARNLIFPPKNQYARNKDAAARAAFEAKLARVNLRVARRGDGKAPLFSLRLGFSHEKRIQA
jgi:hypothetical protein